MTFTVEEAIRFLREEANKIQLPTFRRAKTAIELHLQEEAQIHYQKLRFAIALVCDTAEKHLREQEI